MAGKIWKWLVCAWEFPWRPGALGLGWFWTIKTLHVKHCFWGSKLAFAARATGDHRLNEDLATSPVGGSIDPHAAAWLAWLKCQYLKIPLN